MKAIQYIVVLGLICIVAGFGLAGIFSVTKDRIAEKEAKERAKAQNAVLDPDASKELKFAALKPEASHDEQVVEGRDASGDVAGYAALGEAQGYGGKIRVMVGMDARGERILAVTVVSHSETPGLGSRVAEVKSNKTWLGLIKGDDVGKEQTLSEFLQQFSGCTPDDLSVKIDGITGATISSEAVINAVRQAAGKMQDLRPATPNPSARDATTGATPPKAGPRRQPPQSRPQS